MDATVLERRERNLGFDVGGDFLCKLNALWQPLE